MTPAQELKVKMITTCYDFANHMGMLITEPMQDSTANLLIIARLFEAIDPEVKEIRIIPGGTNFAGLIMHREGPREWRTLTYDTREDFQS